MNTYQITSSQGADLGTYDAETADGALDAMARDAGYGSQAEAAVVAGAFTGTVRTVEMAALHASTNRGEVARFRELCAAGHSREEAARELGHTVESIHALVIGGAL